MPKLQEVSQIPTLSLPQSIATSGASATELRPWGS
ncbi:MAG TPA: mannose-6-phosphate isomerase, partial [Cyanobacteria bacterium UBA11166]|nr:mannose-6-phosphate isomerase [Cyanobacteria bacterium UBA11166]